MTFKQFATGVFYLPARAFYGISALFLGTTYTNKNREEENFRGAFGLIVDAAKFVVNTALDVTKYVVRAVSNFIANHQKAIAVAFWSSLVIAGAAALTVAFWPAALAAVTGFTVGGVSIASLVGTGFAAQVAATAGVAAVVTSAAVYASAAVINTITGIRDFFVSRRKVATSDAQDDVTSSDDQKRSTNPLAGLGKPAARRDYTAANSSSAEDAQTHAAPLFSATASSAANTATEEPTNAATASI